MGRFVMFYAKGELNPEQSLIYTLTNTSETLKLGQEIVFSFFLIRQLCHFKQVSA